MDPLSIVANAIALTKLASAAIKGIHYLNDALRDGPVEILALNNEVADLKAILQISREFTQTTTSVRNGNSDPIETPRRFCSGRLRASTPAAHLQLRSAQVCSAPLTSIKAPKKAPLTFKGVALNLYLHYLGIVLFSICRTGTVSSLLSIHILYSPSHLSSLHILL